MSNARAKRRRISLGAVDSPIEVASEADRLWFAAHPDTNVYMREYVPGEFLVSDLEPPGGTLMVQVTQLHPGVRARLSTYVVLPPVITPEVSAWCDRHKRGLS